MNQKKKQKKQIDYCSLYQKQFKTLPQACFWATFITLSLAAIITGIVLLCGARWTEDYLLALGIMIGGCVVALVLASIEYFFVAVSISQRVVLTDTLLAMKDAPVNLTVDQINITAQELQAANAEDPEAFHINEDELPEL